MIYHSDLERKLQSEEVRYFIYDNVTESDMQGTGNESPRLELDLSIARSGDLSTIIESELSSMSISKHIPPLDNSERSSPHQSSREESTDSDGDLILAGLAKKVHKQSTFVMKPENTDVSTTSSKADKSRNLSASWEAGLADFRRSMGHHLHDVGENSTRSSASTTPSTAQSPFQSSPEDPSSRSSPQSSPAVGDRQISFDLSSLDPDLAALLSPHNIPSRRNDDEDAAIAAAVDAVTPPPPMSLSPSPSPEPEAELGPGRTSSDTEDFGPVANSKRTSGESRRKGHITSLGLQSSPPSRRSRPSSLAMSNSSQSATDPRRSSLDMPGTAKRAGFPHISVVDRELRESPLRRASEEAPVETLASASKRPLLGRSYSALGNSISTGDPTKRRALTPRLTTTPARPSTASGVPKARVASDSRPVLRSSRMNEDQARGYGDDSSPPVGRSASALGLSLNTRRLLGGMADRPGSALSRSVQPSVRTRRRSLSVNEVQGPPIRRAREWINQHTERAFSAAGLLNRDTSDTRDRSASVSTTVTRPESRLRASARISSDHDFRSSVGQNASLYVPGITRSASWGRRESTSRSMTMSELTSARGDSPVTTVTSSTPTSASNPRTAFSSSTATSYSGGSPQQQFQQYQLESTLQALKEKHSLEMEALLSALGDSQRSARTLREENSRLRGRINDLEDQLNDLVEQMEAARRATPSQPAPNYARSMFTYSRPGSRVGSVEPPPKRQMQSRLQTYVVAPDSTDETEDVLDSQITMRESLAHTSPGLVAMAPERSVRNRSSTASSVFPLLPSNMSMLLHEDGDSDNSALYSNYQAQSRATSPTLLLSRLTASNTSSKSKHISRPSVSSIGSADISMMSAPGSPRSLRLNPEHEKNLGDMMSVDFSIIASDE